MFDKFQSFFHVLYVIYRFPEIKDDIQVVSQFSCLLGQPSRFSQTRD